jgi:redox-sensing transcriptional repressor
VPIYDINELALRIPHLKAEIGIVAVPADQAQIVADAATAAGIKALWNFTPFRIRTAPGIVIQDTSMYSHLALIYNRLDTQIQSNQ